MREIYLERQPSARHWFDFADFGFYRLDVIDVYFVGGFGVMGWVDVEEYRQASPDPLADDAPGIVEHMNRDHSDALRLLAASAGGGTIESTEKIAVDRLGFHLRNKANGRYRGSRIAFPREVRDPAVTRAVMVESARPSDRPVG